MSSWKIDSVEFSDFGVGVSKVSGLFNLSKIKNESFDWLDEDGEDYWHEISEQRYADNKINIDCFLVAASETDFTAKLKSFYDALTGEGLRQLETQYTSAAIECYLGDGIDTNRFDRGSRFINSKQAGVFSLVLTVPGDPDFYALEVKRWEPAIGTWTKAIVLTKNLQVRKTLQGDFYATCSFESNQKLNLQYYDYIDINSNGVFAERYFLPADAHFQKVSSNKYLYNLRFNHQSQWLEESQFLDDLGQADFYYYANLEEIIDLMIVNHNRSWWNNFQKGTVVSTIRKNHKFSAESCLAVLKRLCAEYQLEFEFQFVVAGTYAINIKEMVANDKAITLEYGKGKGLYELTRGEPDLSELCTVVFGYGATTNIPAGYRNGMTRLSFDGNPIRKNDDLITENGPREKTIFFNDIYPRRTGTVTAYEQVLQENLTAAQKETYPEGIYKPTDATLFDINAYLSGGLSAKMKFNTGDCAGLEFEICEYDNDTKTVIIVPFKDARGTLYPNDILHPQVGDEYVLIDIEMPESYITSAEAELASATQQYADVFSVKRFPYNTRINPAFIKANPTGFEVGDRVTVIDADAELNGLQRISELIYNVFTKIYEFTLSNKSIYSRLKRLEMKVQTHDRAITDTKKDTVESMRNDQQTTGELRRILLDPADDKLKIDNIVRNGALDPRHISWDLNLPQLFLEGALVETDVDGDYNQVKIGAGTISVANDPQKALNRYEIKKKKDNLEIYDPTRSWAIVAEEFTLAVDDAHFVYAKINIAPGATACTILLTPDRIEPKLEIEDGFVYYELGTIPAAEEIV